jgi:hypothetical protein
VDGEHPQSRHHQIGSHEMVSLSRSHASSESENRRNVARAAIGRTALALLLVASLSAAQESAISPDATVGRRPSLGVYALEGTGGVALGALGLGCGFCAALAYGGNDEGRTTGAVAILLAVSPALAVVGCAGGTSLVGSAFRQDGRFLPTLAYTAGTGAVACGLLLGGQTMLNGPFGYHGVIGWSMIGLGIAGVAATPVAAVYGYNRSRPLGTYGSRFVPGSITLGSVKGTDGRIHPSLNVRLLNVRI